MQTSIHAPDAPNITILCDAGHCTTSGGADEQLASYVADSPLFMWMLR